MKEHETGNDDLVIIVRGKGKGLEEEIKANEKDADVRLNKKLSRYSVSVYGMDAIANEDDLKTSIVKEIEE